MVLASLTYFIPSLNRLETFLDVSSIGEKNHVNVISQLRHGGQDKHQGRKDHHSHRGEGVKLKKLTTR